MHAGVLDVLEHSADHGGLAITDAIHVELDRILEELVDQHRLAGHDVEHLADDVLQLGFTVEDEHAAAAEDKGRADEHGVTELRC